MGVAVMTAGTLTLEAGRLRRGALAALREGRVVVLGAHTARGASRPSGLLAQVDGHSGLHVVELDAGCWSCSCPAGPVCAHLVAVRLVARDLVDLGGVG